VPVETVRPSRIGKAELAAGAAVSVVALALVGLIWIVTLRAVDEQRAEVLDRAEQSLKGQAATIAETVGHELLLIDQSLTILQAAWKADSDSVDLAKWQQTMPALMSVADDLFIADQRHIIRQDIMPQAVGQGVGAAYVTFPHGSLETYESDGTKDKEALLLQGEAGAPVDARQFLMYVVRLLDHPKGWIIGASYRSTELTKLFAGGALGFNPVVALMDTRRGIVQAVVGPAARRPKVDVSKTPLFAAISRAKDGIWQGDTGIDGVDRINAFHRVADRDMVVVVAAATSEVMRPAESLNAGARSLALVGTALVVLIGGLVLWELYTVRDHRRRQRILERNRGELERLRADDVMTSARAQINAARLQMVLDNTVDGIALFDSSFKLVQWNYSFRRGIGIEPRQDMPLDTLLREQISSGLLGSLANIEAEVARRADLLRTGDTSGVTQPGPDNETLVLRGFPIPEGGFVLMLGGLARWETARNKRQRLSDQRLSSGD
jgi:PAS domain-containing protein